MKNKNIVNREGEVYDVIQIEDMRFEILYGYNEEFERDSGEPIPIYPDFNKYPAYERNGYPIVTQIQEPCEYFVRRSSNYSELWCGSCKHFPEEQKIIGICRCEKRRKEVITREKEVNVYEELV